MTIINRLKNGVGEEKDFYIPRNTSVLFKTKPIRFTDEEIPEDLRERNLKLLFNPDLYTIKRDAQTGEIALKNISEQTVELPKECAHFRPSKIMPEIVYNGYLLCIDKSLEGKLSAEEEQEVLNIVKHFQKFDKQNPHEVCLHELKHLKNSEILDRIHQNGQRLPDEHFRLAAELDEITALSSEKFTPEISEQQALQIIRETCADWQTNPRFETYLRPNGELDHLLSAYQEQHRGKPEAPTNNMYKEIAKAYLTFKINGKDCDLSPALDARFMLLKKQTLTTQVMSLTRQNKRS